MCKEDWSWIMFIGAGSALILAVGIFTSKEYPSVPVWDAQGCAYIMNGKRVSPIPALNKITCTSENQTQKLQPKSTP